MGALSEILAPSPKAKLIEALCRLGPIEITRGELAREAGLYRTTANRVLPDLCALGLVVERDSDGEKLVRANADSLVLKLLVHLNSSLDYATAALMAAGHEEIPVPMFLEESRRILASPMPIADAITPKVQTLNRRQSTMGGIIMGQFPETRGSFLTPTSVSEGASGSDTLMLGAQEPDDFRRLASIASYENTSPGPAPPLEVRR